MPQDEVRTAGPLRPAGRFVRIAVWLNWAVCVISYVVMLGDEVETVLKSGPIIMLCGLALIATAYFARCTPVAWIGVANCAVCVLFYGCVHLFRWSPRSAEMPFALMGAAYVLGLLPLVLHAHRRAPRTAEDCCTVCGYLLIGLPEPRCPECGTPFDPSTVRGKVSV